MASNPSNNAGRKFPGKYQNLHASRIPKLYTDLQTDLFIKFYLKTRGKDLLMVKTDNSLDDFVNTQAICFNFNRIRCLTERGDRTGAIAEITLLDVPF